MTDGMTQSAEGPAIGAVEAPVVESASQGEVGIETQIEQQQTGLNAAHEQLADLNTTIEGAGEMTKDLPDLATEVQGIQTESNAKQVELQQAEAELGAIQAEYNSSEAR